MHPIYGFGPAHSLIYLHVLWLLRSLISIIVLIPCWFIFKKAGFSPFLALLMFVPLINIIMMYFLAFARWNVVPAGMVYPARRPFPTGRRYDLAS